MAAFLGLLVIALSLSSFLALSYSAAGSVNAAAVHSQLRRSMDRIAAELVAADGVTGIWPGSYIMYNRLTPSGRFQGAVYHDRYGKRLYGYKNNRWDVFANGVDDIRFTLFDANGAVTTNPGDAVAVGVRLEGSGRMVRHTYSDQVFTRVLLRNKASGGA